MNPIKKPKFQLSDLGKNPTLEGFEIPVTVRSKSNTFVLKDGIHLPQEYTYEYEEYTKVFRTKELREYVSNLSDKAQRLYLWLQYEVDPGQDFLWINKARYMKENGIKSYTTYHNAKQELYRYLFIYPTAVKDVYWINPKIFFCGDRLSKFSDKITIKYDYR